MSRLIIGLCGKKGAGKDTVAKHLKSLMGSHQTHIISFAKALYEKVSKEYGVPEEVLKDRVFKESVSAFFNPFKTGFTNWFTYIGYAVKLGFKSPREVLQWYGTDFVRRYYSDDYWIRILSQTINKNLDSNHNYIITDVRFPNEVAFVTSFEQSYVAKIVRDETIRAKNFDKIATTSAHSSERALDNMQIEEYYNDEGKAHEAAEKILEAALSKLPKQPIKVAEVKSTI